MSVRIAFALSSLIFLFGCGKKAEPVVPGAKPPVIAPEKTPTSADSTAPGNGGVTDFTDVEKSLPADHFLEHGKLFRFEKPYVLSQYEEGVEYRAPKYRLVEKLPSGPGAACALVTTEWESKKESIQFAVPAETTLKISEVRRAERLSRGKTSTRLVVRFAETKELPSLSLECDFNGRATLGSLLTVIGAKSYIEAPPRVAAAPTGDFRSLDLFGATFHIKAPGRMGYHDGQEVVMSYVNGEPTETGRRSVSGIEMYCDFLVSPVTRVYLGDDLHLKAEEVTIERVRVNNGGYNVDAHRLEVKFAPRIKGQTEKMWCNVPAAKSPIELSQKSFAEIVGAHVRIGK